MTLAADAWWAAMVGAAQFEDGSLVIEDDTLDVDGGSTVNLRVKLGARPRSDVTVALSETSALISLGTDSLTFTPANWDDYQDVVVTGVGNRQSWVLTGGGASISDVGFTTTEFQDQAINGAFLANANDTVYPGNLFFTTAGSVGLYTTSDRTDQGGGAGPEMSAQFETNGQIYVQWAEDANGAIDPPVEITVAGPNAPGSTVTDNTEPYNWTPSNSAEVAALHGTLTPPFGGFDGTLTLRDYTPAAATISLSASGPDEYAGVTDSATVTVD